MPWSSGVRTRPFRPLARTMSLAHRALRCLRAERANGRGRAARTPHESARSLVPTRAGTRRAVPAGSHRASRPQRARARPAPPRRSARRAGEMPGRPLLVAPSFRPLGREHGGPPRASAPPARPSNGRSRGVGARRTTVFRPFVNGGGGREAPCGPEDRHRSSHGRPRWSSGWKAPVLGLAHAGIPPARPCGRWPEPGALSTR